MKTREERKQELNALVQTDNGEARLMLIHMEAVGDIGKIDTPVSALIDAILDAEFRNEPN